MNDLENGTPLPGISSPLDPVKDYFRIRLVCSVLDTCGSSFKRGPTALKLDQFLTFFQMYAFTKVQPVPMDVEFMYMDTIEMLRPKLKMFLNYEQAAYHVNALILEELQNHSNTLLEDEEEEDQEDHITTCQQESNKNQEQQVISPTDQEMDQEDSDSSNGEQENHDLDLDFEKEFSKMCLSNERKRMEKKIQPFDASIPIKSKSMMEPTQTTHQQGVAFTLLTKKGNKPQSKSLILPSDSPFALSTLSKQAQDLKEKKELKKIVLGYQDRLRTFFCL